MGENGVVSTPTCDNRMRDLRKDLEQDIVAVETRCMKALSDHRENCPARSGYKTIIDKILALLAAGALTLAGGNYVKGVFSNENNAKSVDVQGAGNTGGIDGLVGDGM